MPEMPVYGRLERSAQHQRQKVTEFSPPPGRLPQRILNIDREIVFTKIYSIRDDEAGYLWLGNKRARFFVANALETEVPRGVGE